MAAAQEQAKRAWCVCLDKLAYHIPALLEVFRRTAKLEVIDVDDQEELQLLVPKARAPWAKLLETDAG